jgi:Coenzyme PQQ synthesis protein D (PqqD)
MSASARPDRRSDLIFRKIDADVCVYDPIRDRVLLLNATSALILDLCDGTRTWEEIEAQVAVAFSVDREIVSKDVEAMRERFRRAGLLRSGTGG